MRAFAKRENLCLILKNWKIRILTHIFTIFIFTKFFSIISFANQTRLLERSIELSDDGNGFKLDFWPIFEMWEQSKTTCTYTIKTYISIFKGQTKVFTLRKCAQSILRIKLPLDMSFFWSKIWFLSKNSIFQRNSIFQWKIEKICQNRKIHQSWQTKIEKIAKIGKYWSKSKKIPFLHKNAYFLKKKSWSWSR